MKTSAELQQQSFVRKLVYFGLILVLFTVMSFSGRFVAMARGKPTPWTVAAQARTLQLSESEHGEADLAGSTIRLALSGTRGFAITGFWLATIEKQKKHEWNEVEFLVNTITKLQPHFLTPWLFQSWNLAYNVAVESDRVRDKYFYISRGIELLAAGERINRLRAVDADGNPYELGNPDMRFWTGFYYTSKFGTSDEQNTLRSLLQMSCISPAKRDPGLLMPDKRNVDPQAFREFVRQNPMLCRRLRDSLRCSRPEQVVDFLKDNARIPGRYHEVDGNWVLARPEDQFPALPANYARTESVSPFREFQGYFDSYHCSWAWYLFAQEPLPTPEYGKPSGVVINPDPLRYRVPRQPATIIFRQQPPRGLSYIAERLQKEGFFDESGWEVDAGRQTEQWFPGETLVVAAGDVNYSSQALWQRAYQEWQEHGKRNGLLLSEQERQNLRRRAELYATTYGLQVEQRGPDLEEDQVSREMWDSFDANRQLVDLNVNLQMTNFRHFLYQSQAESDARTVRARRLFYEADRLRGTRQDEALRAYEEAFAVLVGADGRQGLLEAYPEFRRDSTFQEELVEKHLAYLYVLDQWRGPQARAIVSRVNVLAGAALGANPTQVVAATLYGAFPRPGELPPVFTGPLEGLDSKGDPWLLPESVYAIRVKHGLSRPSRNPPPNVMGPASAGGPRP